MKQNNRWSSATPLMRVGSIVLGGGLALACIAITAEALALQDGETSSSHRDRPNVVREVSLDSEAGAVLHLSFLISQPLVDAKSKTGCRVASVLGFTTVNDNIQYDLAHASPLLPLNGKTPIEFMVGFDEGGRSGDYVVRLEPKVDGSWDALTDVDDLEITTIRQ